MTNSPAHSELLHFLSCYIFPAKKKNSYMEAQCFNISLNHIKRKAHNPQKINVLMHLKNILGKYLLKPGILQYFIYILDVNNIVNMLFVKLNNPNI